jgi:hypothetical protein
MHQIRIIKEIYLKLLGKITKILQINLKAKGKTNIMAPITGVLIIIKIILKLIIQ